MDVISVDLQEQDPEYKRHLCEALERGNILVLQQTPFLPSEEDAAFLRAQRQVASASHKNVAYKPHLKKLTGAAVQSSEEAERIRSILARYSEGAIACLSSLFPHYAPHWRVDYASYRPVEEKGRDLPLRHRNDLMHIDAFPTRPTHGGRILRAFTNLHAGRERVWATSASFEDLAARFAVEAGLGRVSGPLAGARRSLSQVGRLVGIRVPNRSPYDEFMLRFHHYLKGNEDFQRNGVQTTTAFSPGATWITYTDQVAHAVVSGQYAVEQTCIVPYSAMLLPELSPVAVLERLAGRPLTAPRPPLDPVADGPERVTA